MRRRRFLRNIKKSDKIGKKSRKYWINHKSGSFFITEKKLEIKLFFRNRESEVCHVSE